METETFIHAVYTRHLLYSWPYIDRIGATISSEAIRMPSSAMRPVSSSAHVGSPLVFPWPNTWNKTCKKKQVTCGLMQITSSSILYPIQIRLPVKHHQCKHFQRNALSVVVCFGPSQKQTASWLSSMEDPFLLSYCEMAILIREPEAVTQCINNSMSHPEERNDVVLGNSLQKSRSPG